MTKAFIVWNSDKSEGVIFVEDDKPISYIQSAEQDAMQAMTGKRYNVAWSALAETFNDMNDEGENIMVETTAEILRDL